MSNDENVTDLLAGLAAGNEQAAERLMPLVYDQLRRLAQDMLGNESPGHTLQATALVNEAYLRMARQAKLDWRGKSQFFAISAKMMRRILVDHARGKKRHKRGGDMQRVSLPADVCVSSRNEEDVLAVEEALEKLADRDPRQAEIVEMRFFGGMTVDEVAEVLGVSKRTVEAEWTMVRAWLRRELSGEQ